VFARRGYEGLAIAQWVENGMFLSRSPLFYGHADRIENSETTYQVCCDELYLVEFKNGYIGIYQRARLQPRKSARRCMLEWEHHELHKEVGERNLTRVWA